MIQVEIGAFQTSHSEKAKMINSKALKISYYSEPYFSSGLSVIW